MASDVRFRDYFFRHVTEVAATASFTRVKSPRSEMILRRTDDALSVFVAVSFPSERMEASVLVGWSRSHETPDLGLYVPTLERMRTSANGSFSDLVSTTTEGWVAASDLPFPGPNWVALQDRDIPEPVLAAAFSTPKGSKARDFLLQHYPGSSEAEKLASLSWGVLFAFCGYEPTDADLHWASIKALSAFVPFVTESISESFKSGAGRT
jgi:hypothetical protein